MTSKALHEKRHGRRTRLWGHPHDSLEVRLSKTLSYALRHGAQDLQLEMRPSGFVSLTQLLALPLFHSFTEEQVERVVDTNAKKRFTLMIDESNSMKLIRANQGHTLPSIQDDELLIPLETPYLIPNCIHGTYFKYWHSIWNNGLSKMKRNHIHFTETIDTNEKVISGMRANCNLLIYLDLPMAMTDGIKFYKSSNNVVLSPGMGDTGSIDNRYFLRVVMKDGTVVYKRNETKETRKE